MGVLMRRQKLGSRVHVVPHQLAVPGPDRDIGDGVAVTGQVRALGKTAVEDVQLTLGFHGETVDRVLELLRRIGVKMPEPATQVGRRTHLPEQPVQGFGAPCGIGGQEGAEFFRQVKQDRTGLEDTDRRLDAAVQQRRNLRVRIDLDEAAGELITLADADQPGVVLGAGFAQRQQFLKQDGHLHAIGRGQ